jgi:integrase
MISVFEYINIYTMAVCTVIPMVESLLKRMPTLEIQGSVPESERERFLTEDKLKRLLYHANQKLRLIILLGLFTGMRLSEILSLCWRNVDLPNGVILIESKDSKNKKPRQVELNSTLTAELKSVKIEGCEFVFPSPRGGHLKDIKNPLKRALTKAGIAHSQNTIPGEENFVFHTLRHSFASYKSISIVST